MVEPRSDDVHVADDARTRGWLIRWGIALGLAAVAVVLTVALRDFLRPHVYLFFFTAVALSAWLAGFWPTLMVSVIGIVAVDLLFYAPVGALTGPDARAALSLALFLVVAGIINLVTSRLGRARRDAERSATQLDAVVEQVPVGLVIAEAPSGRVIRANARTAEIWRGSPPRLEGIGDGETLPAFHVETGRPYTPEEWPLARAVANGEVVRNEEIDIARGDGTRGTVRVSAAPVRRADGAIVAGVVAFDDITERKRAEERLRFLADGSRILASSLDYDETLGRVADLVVPGFSDWFVLHMLADGERLDPVQVAHVDLAKVAFARKLMDRYPPRADAPYGPLAVIRSRESVLLRELPDSVLAASADDEEHLRLLRELGLRSAIVVPLAARGRMLGTITFVQSESDRRFDERDLSLAEELAARVALAVENARLYREAGRSRAEAEHRAREEAALRRAAEAVTAAFSTDEVIRGIADSALEATDADSALVERVDPSRNETEIAAVAGERTLPLGDRSPYHGSLAERIVGERGSVVVRDLSTDPRAPENLRRVCGGCSAVGVPVRSGEETLGALLLLREPGRGPFADDEVGRARTFADLASLALHKVRLLEDSERRRRELQRVLDSQSRLVRGFSHDVKNPLGAADGRLALLEEGVLDGLSERQREHIGRIRRSVGTALRLIDSLVEFARAEAGRIPIRRGLTDVGAVVREIAEEHRDEAGAARLALNVEVPAALPMVLSDPDRIRQILGNLLSNAIKYTECGGVRVRVTAREDDRAPGPGRWIAVDVADTGPGIPEDKREAVFGEFTRLEPGEGRGAGLGLAISRRLARLLGGEITLESEVGVGSTFTLWLPVAGREAERASAGAGPAVGASKRGRHRQGRATDGASPARRDAGRTRTGEEPSFALRGLIREVAAGRDVVAVAGRIAESARTAVDADGAYLERIEDGRDEAEVIARAGPCASSVPTRVSFRGSLIERAVETGSPEIIDDLAATDRSIAASVTEACGRCRALAVPLVSKDRALGALVLLRRRERPEFTPADAREVGPLADLAAIALRRTVLAAEVKRERLALEASESRFRALTEQATLGVFIIDERSTIEYVNPAGAAIFGYERDELLGRSLTALMPEDQRARHRAAVRRYLATGEPRIAWSGIELPGLTRDGRVIPLDISFGEFEREGRRYFTGLVREISERKAAEAERERLLFEQRLLADVSTVLVSALDYEETLNRVGRELVPRLADICAVDVMTDGDRLRRVTVVQTDPARAELAREALRFPPDLRTSPAGRAILEHRPRLIPEVTDEWIEAFTRDAAHRRIIEAFRPRSTMLVPLVARGRTLGVLSLTMSESGRRYDEHDLALAEEVARRAALAADNARLYQAAEAASRAKSDFLAVMSHELRTPLTAIIGYEELLEQGIAGPLTDEQRTQLGRIRASAVHLRELIEEILTFSRLESGREERRLERVDVALLVAETAGVIEPTAREKGLRFELELPDAPVEAETDPPKLRRILLNLLNNAVAFTDEGWVRLALERPDDRLVFRIEDTGIGIAPDVLGRIFEPFWQEERGLTREVSGTGLGLAVARRLARMLGGDVTVESRVGEGSVFTVVLPRRAPGGRGREGGAER